MAYVPVTFVDGVTPLNAANLNHLEDAIEELDARPAGGGAELVFEGDWAAPTTYQDGDYVVKDGIVYVCVGGPTTTPPDASLWGGPTGVAPSSVVTYGTAFPASPVNGQEHILVDSLTAATYQWRFRYNASRADGYRWEFVGGCPAVSEVGSDGSLQATASATYVDLTTVGPSITVPNAGVYLVSLGATGYTTAGDIWMSYAIGATPAADADAIVWSEVASLRTNNARTQRKTLAAGAALVAKYKQSGTGTITVSKRWMHVLPVAVA